MSLGLPGPVFAVIGDIHFRPNDPQHPLFAVLRHIAAQDVAGILLVGDLAASSLRRSSMGSATVVSGYRARVAAALAHVSALQRPVFWVPGNHDLPDIGRGADADVLPGNVDGTVVELAGLRVAGLGGAGPDRFGFCYEWDEESVRRRLVPECDVLLCHAPPRDTPLDVTLYGEHVGSAAIRERAMRHRGVLLCGHIHESPGVTKLGDCLVVNAGGLGHPFGKARVAYIGAARAAVVIDLESGERFSGQR